MTRSSPRASSGLSRLAASSAPDVCPAPSTVCSSSMNRMTRPSLRAASSSTALKRSSNSPRYLAPASSAPRSSDTTRAFSVSGTSPDTMRDARPSTTALLPLPGGPRRTGLFLRRRARIWNRRRMSASRPITGSSLPFSASSHRSTPYLASASQLSSAPAPVTARPPRSFSTAADTAACVRRASLNGACSSGQLKKDTSR
mmetsp:Transcript_5694/g.18133  ORF Transcript_5694/g.18133 Transcript_5694/m.18133 type:complete len:200 (-) Transcript_5694:385-984(-)